MPIPTKNLSVKLRTEFSKVKVCQFNSYLFKIHSFYSKPLHLKSKEELILKN